MHRRENCDVPSVDGVLATMCLDIDFSYLLILYDIDVACQYHNPLGRSRNLGSGASSGNACTCVLDASALVEVTGSIPM